MKKRDYILIGCILLVAAVCAGFFLLTGKEAQEAVVTVDREVYGTYSGKGSDDRDSGWESSAYSEWTGEDGVGRLSGSALRTPEGNLQDGREYHLSSESGRSECTGQ